MENATKALLIAGSVLIAILLITMGIKIFSSTKDTVDSTQTVMDSTAKSMIINQFSPYVGDNKTASEVRTLMNKILAYNSTCEESQQVAIQGLGGIRIPHKRLWEFTHYDR